MFPYDGAMAILTNRPGVGYVASSDLELDRQLREGDGLAWSGDPRLELRYAIITASHSGYDPNVKRWVRAGEQVAKRYEVWRYNEDGTETSIGHWLMIERDRILYDLVQMRAGAEGRMDDVVTRIDAQNEANERRLHSEFRDKYGEMMEHLHKLQHDRNNPRNVFRGMPGRNPEKQM